MRELRIVGAPPDPDLHELTELAASICETPVALISLVEEEQQFFGAQVGLGNVCSTPRDVAFCAHALTEPEIFVVADALSDQRFVRNPLVTAPPFIRFYAGVPLRTAEGHAVGTLCVIDRKPRELTAKQELALQVLGRQAVTQLELRRSNTLQQEAEEKLHSLYSRLEQTVQERTGELEKARSRLQLAVSAANIGWWEWNIGAQEIYLSAESRAQLGCSEVEIPGDLSSWRSRVHPEDLAAADVRFEQHLRNPSRDYEGELRVRHRDGSYRWILIRARTYPGADGKPHRMSGCHIDITERKTGEERLRDSRAQLRALAEHLRKAREEETTRIARELHDELGSNLTGIQLELATLERQVGRLLPEAESAQVRERVRSIGHLVEQTIGGVRKVCRDLRPAVLEELGLAAAIDALVGDFEVRTGLPCAVQRPEAVSIATAHAGVLYRVLQELLTNVARHAQAGEVSVELREREGAWELEVCDDGAGLPPDALARRDRFGLVGLRERVLAAGGRIEFSRPERGGTLAIVSLPRAAPE